MKKTKRYEEGGDVDPLEAANQSDESQSIANEAKGEAMLKAMRDKESAPKAKPAMPALGMNDFKAAPSKPKNPNFSNEGRSTPAPAAKPVASGAMDTAGFEKPKPTTSKVGRAGQATGSSNEPSFQDKQAMEYLQAKRDKAAGKNTGFFSGLFGGSQRSRKYKTENMASGGMVSSASKRADGIAQKGKTRGKMC